MNTKLLITIMGAGILILAACAQPLPAGSVTPTPDISPTETQVATDPVVDGQITVTLEDQGKTISLVTGEEFLLKLGEDYNWDIVITNQNVLSRVTNITVVRGAQGVYQALQAGTTILTGTGEPPCQQFKPPCEMPSIYFEITVVVKG